MVGSISGCSAWLAIFAALVLASPAAAIDIAVSGDAVEIDGVVLRFPIAESELVRALGEPTSVLPPSADEYSNRVVNWLELGIVAFSRQRTTSIHALSLLVREQMYWKGELFAGTVWVDNFPLPTGFDPILLEIMGFAYSSSSWKHDESCLYVGVATVGVGNDTELLDKIEIGLRTECDPSSPFYPEPVCR